MKHKPEPCYVCGREAVECGLCNVCKVGRERWEPLFGKEGDPYQAPEREGIGWHFIAYCAICVAWIAITVMAWR